MKEFGWSLVVCGCALGVIVIMNVIVRFSLAGLALFAAYKFARLALAGVRSDK